ncbi:MAG: hypothetical protein LBS82_05545 [Spirochaetaceae bacterium]|nr:hypothetical protein [Spirochaetaceae bacterium]
MNVSSSAEVIVAIIPIVGIVMGAVVVFFHLLWSHRRKMLLIQTKQFQSQDFDLEAFSLFAGLLLAVVGICLTVFLAIFTRSGMTLLGGIIPLSCGCALLLFFIINRTVHQRPKK